MYYVIKLLLCISLYVSRITNDALKKWITINMQGLLFSLRSKKRRKFESELKFKQENPKEFWKKISHPKGNSNR